MIIFITFAIAFAIVNTLPLHYCSVFSPKDAVRAIKKRIVGNKNFKEVMLGLTVSSSLYFSF